MTIRLNLTPLQTRTLAHCALNGWGDGDMAEHFTREEAAACYLALEKICKAGRLHLPARPDLSRCMGVKSTKAQQIKAIARGMTADDFGQFEP